MTIPTRQRAAIAVVQVLGLTVWFSAGAVAPALGAQLRISTASAAWLTSSVQIGFAAGAIVSAVGVLADRFAAQRLLAVSACGAAACTAALALLPAGVHTAIALRMLTGVLLAGVYPVGMKLMASWSDPAERGRGFGVLLGALTIGSALPHLIAGLGSLPWRAVLLCAAALTAAAAPVALTVLRPGPNLTVRTTAWNPRKALSGFADRRPRLVLAGYLGHMWELYALWSWVSVFALTGHDRRGHTAAELTTFATMGLAGAAGCVLAGWASDRFGRSPAAVAPLAVSGICCLASPFLFTAPTAVLVAFLAVWGASVIADSPVFSTALSETSDPRFVGTTLTAQTATGFLVTVASIQLVPIVAGAAGWRYAFLVLAPGPLIGAAAMSALNRNPRGTHRDHHRQTQPAACRADRRTLAHGAAR